VDDSKFSGAAVDFVAKNPWPRGTKVVAVSASPPIFVGPGEVASSDALEKLLEEQASYHRDLARKAAKALNKGALSVEGRMVLGDPRSALVETAKEERADLLVVGSHGRTGLTKLLLGSVAAHVVAHAPCSVLVVKPARGR
jgi:nucleotide-binding universal stress UspA family protein